MAMSGLNAEDVILARRWLNEEKLGQVAPWLKKILSNQPQTTSAAHGADNSTYQKNLTEYRRLVADALGEI
jgi:ubiquitin-protein ligase